MRIKIHCDNCAAVGWGRGEDDPDTNAIEITEFPDEWEDVNSDTCEHDGEVTIIDADSDDSDD